MEISDGAKVAGNGFFNGYDAVVWSAISLHSFGGLLVAVVVKFADNILKGYSTSVAILLTCLLSVYFFGAHLNGVFLLGVAFVCTSIFLYSKYPAAPTANPTATGHKPSLTEANGAEKPAAFVERSAHHR